MALRSTNVVTLSSTSAGAFTADFDRAFSAAPSYVIVMGKIQNEEIGVFGSPTLPFTITLDGITGGSVEVRVNGLTPSVVQAEVLSNSLGSGQIARLNFLAKK